MTKAPPGMLLRFKMTQSELENLIDVAKQVLQQIREGVQPEPK